MKIKKFNENLESNDNIALELNNAMIYGIKQFGIYSFEDKGPDEVMDLGKFDNIMATKSIEDIADILNKFYDLTNDKEHAKYVIESIITNLDNRDDFEDLWDYDKYDIFSY